jgi:hypothetical protein
MNKYNQLHNAISIIFMLPILIVGIFVCLWEELEALYENLSKLSSIKRR